MSSFLLLLPLLALVHPVLSTPLDSNLAYRSPYANFPSLGHDTPALHKRHHSAGQHQSKRHIKRQAQTIRPSGSPDTYTLSGYGGHVAHWDDASYIYAGDLNFSEHIPLCPRWFQGADCER